jgi:hypothetical protein
MKYSIKPCHPKFKGDNRLFVFEDNIQCFQASAVELEFWARIQELESEVAHWKSNHDNQKNLKSQLMDRPDLKDRAASIQKLQERIAELETQNEVLIETGHWIGQDEAHDLKVAVQKFLDYARIGGLGSDSKGVIFVPLWQMQELRDALNNCGEFKSYSAAQT